MTLQRSTALHERCPSGISQRIQRVRGAECRRIIDGDDEVVQRCHRKRKKRGRGHNRMGAKPPYRRPQRFIGNYFTSITGMRFFLTPIVFKSPRYGWDPPFCPGCWSGSSQRDTGKSCLGLLGQRRYSVRNRSFRTETLLVRVLPS